MLSLKRGQGPFSAIGWNKGYVLLVTWAFSRQKLKAVPKMDFRLLETVLEFCAWVGMFSASRAMFLQWNLEFVTLLLQTSNWWAILVWKIYTLLSMSYEALCDLASAPLTSSGHVIPLGGNSYGLGSAGILPLPVESSGSWLVSCLFRAIREHPAFLQPAVGSLLGDLQSRAKGHKGGHRLGHPHLGQCSVTIRDDLGDQPPALPVSLSESGPPALSLLRWNPDILPINCLPLLEQVPFCCGYQNSHRSSAQHSSFSFKASVLMSVFLPSSCKRQNFIRLYFHPFLLLLPRLRINQRSGLILLIH